MEKGHTCETLRDDLEDRGDEHAGQLCQRQSIGCRIKVLQTKHLAGSRIQLTCRIEAISLLELAERLPGEGTVESIDRSGIEAGGQQALLETANECVTRLAMVSRRRGRKRWDAAPAEAVAGLPWCSQTTPAIRPATSNKAADAASVRGCSRMRGRSHMRLGRCRLKSPRRRLTAAVVMGILRSARHALRTSVPRMFKSRGMPLAYCPMHCSAACVNNASPSSVAKNRVMTSFDAVSRHR